MHFLSSSLTGRALDAIKNVPITADNFDIAWKALVSRYENKRRLIEVHVSSLLNLSSVSRESALELNELRDRATRAIASLRSLKRSDEEILNDLLVHCVCQRLDPVTRKAWKLRRGDEQTIPTYDDLDRFITFRARALEELAPISAAKLARANKITSATASKTTAIACPLCKSSHYINTCSLFVKKSPLQRAQITKRENRCINCLSAKHAVSACPSKYVCRTCQQKPHSMLHSDTNSASVKGSNSHVAKPAKEAESTSITALNSTKVTVSRP